MKRKRMLIPVLAAMIAAAGIFLGFSPDAAFASGSPAQSSLLSLTVLPTDVDTAGDQNVFIGIEGEYICDIQSALDLINSYRKEACEEGVINPSTGKKLTMDDYVPIKWSSDLEYIARIRAAEAALTMDHARLTDKSIWRLQGPKGTSSSGEVIAWNWSRSMTAGITQWYAEKSDWVNNTGGVTGHYTQMIDPANLYVGLATFYSDSTTYPNTTTGEFSTYSGLDETEGKSTGTIIQKLEVSKSYLSNIAVAEDGSRFYLSVTVRVKDYWGAYVSTPGLEILGNISWSSSNSKVVALDSSGNITKKSCGSATVSGTYEGTTYKLSYSVSHSYGSWKTTKAATCTESGLAKRTCSICGNVESKTLSATGHNGTTSYVAAKQATCVSKGNVAYYHCEQCGKNFSDAKGQKEISSVVTSVDSSNHVNTEIRNAVSATADRDGYTGDTYCKDCGVLIKSGEVQKATGTVGSEGNSTSGEEESEGNTDRADESESSAEGENIGGNERTDVSEEGAESEKGNTSEDGENTDANEAGNPGADDSLTDLDHSDGTDQGSQGTDTASGSDAEKNQEAEDGAVSPAVVAAAALAATLAVFATVVVVIMRKKRRFSK